MPFGQVVIGPPGSGKTTYCHGVQQYLRAAQRRVALVNLDPANDVLPYEPEIDVCDLVCLESVMQELGLGPNGGLVYCIEYLEKNLDWLMERLAPLEAEGAYFVFDCPGQVELFTQHDGLKHILEALSSRQGYRLAAVHLVDAHLCTEPAKYIAALLLALSTMLHLELPHINVLSKVDLLRHYGSLDFSLDFYTEVQDLSYLVRAMGNDRFGAKHRKLSAELCELVQDFGLVSFIPLAIEDKESLQAVLNAVDKANGALFASLANPQLGLPPEFVYGSAHRGEDDDLTRLMEERYLGKPKGSGTVSSSGGTGGPISSGSGGTSTAANAPSSSGETAVAAVAAAGTSVAGGSGKTEGSGAAADTPNPAGSVSEARRRRELAALAAEAAQREAEELAIASEEEEVSATRSRGRRQLGD